MISNLTTFSLPSSSSKTALIIGGTSGIGAACARRLAKVGCARIIVVGRSEEKGKDACEKIRKIKEGVEVVFVQGDVGTTAATKACLEEIKKEMKDSGIDYLIMCQNGAPSGRITLNSEGHVPHFPAHFPRPAFSSPFIPTNPDSAHRICTEVATQCLSRFLIAYELSATQSLNENGTIISICNPGQSFDDLSIDDLALSQVKESGRSGFAFFANQSKRDSTIIDSAMQEMSTQFPHYRYFHLAPGLVRSEGFAPRILSWPFPFNYLAWLGFWIIGKTPDQYAITPVYVAITNDAESGVKGRLLDRDLKEITLGKWASVEENRKALWTKLMQIRGE